MILGLGNDLVSVSRLARSVERSGEAFLRKVYTAEELESAPPPGTRRNEYLAGRWAAKEALAKALGCGITEHCRLNEICTLNDPGNGRPRLTLSGAARHTAERLGVNSIHLSIAHEHDYAIATVVLEGLHHGHALSPSGPA